ncbi:hypothetical protein NSK_003488 [Nannochloropsis salina CCMP1776]|uniref:Uncharacterized protein n=1 Tax=Nannochloropsis salina CCMP1776 TaxID=1027361 RepID=A0A4D9D247_9STRA|nr:hypothetical protein NSK_003488 [Nannochloropsis salina CCMP1776]|eukprot:TFJ85064.1 hypothetical protein NSK_003488 [Nannochloropsis salina CCMP1776]
MMLGTRQDVDRVDIVFTTYGTLGTHPENRYLLTKTGTQATAKVHLIYPGLHKGHVFPQKGVAAADASLSLTIQRALDDIMVAIFTNHTNGRRVIACGLSSVGQKLAETEPKSLKVVFSRLHNHSCVDLDLRRHVDPHVLEWLHARFAAGECSAQAIRAEMEKNREKDGDIGQHRQNLSLPKVQRLMGEWFRGRYESELLAGCQDLAQHHFDDLNSGMEAKKGKAVFKRGGALSTFCDHFASGDPVHSKDRDNGWAIAIVLPFMTRVHERVQQAGETH